MFNLDVWNILGIIAIVCLAVTFRMGKNPIWGSLNWGILISIVVLIVNLIIGNGFNWKPYQNILTVAVLFGTLTRIVNLFLDEKYNFRMNIINAIRAWIEGSSVQRSWDGMIYKNQKIKIAGKTVRFSGRYDKFINDLIVDRMTGNKNLFEEAIHNFCFDNGIDSWSLPNGKAYLRPRMGAFYRR